MMERDCTKKCNVSYLLMLFNFKIIFTSYVVNIQTDDGWLTGTHHTTHEHDLN